MEITEVLARRTDLSTFLVHLTRDTSPTISAKRNLISIIRQGRIEARSPFGMAVRALDAAHQAKDSQRCVCFTETPLQHVKLLTEAIENRVLRFQPYGIAITRKLGRELGANPVWYLDITPGHDWLTTPVNEFVDEAIAADEFEDRIAKLTPFIEQMGTGEGYRKEFWWEREWRHRGNFNLPPWYTVLCPQDDVAEIKGVVEELNSEPSVSYVDPGWSLEMIIGRLAGVPFSKLGPF